MEENIVIDPSLKIGTGDDELVDNIVKGAKSSLGGVGSFIPDQMVTNTLKGAKISNLSAKKEKKVETRNYVSKTRDDIQAKLLDDEGLPLVYSQEGIQQYWSGKSGELVSRWTEFLSLSSPFLLRVLTSLATNRYEQNEKDITKDFRVILEKLGPTYVKMGQMLSIRPDIIGDTAMLELKKLQDGVKKFPTEEAMDVIRLEYGIDDIGEVFKELSVEPVAAASLAQVYKGTLLTGETVAVKVQRPGTLSIVSKDLYVLRRASELF